MLQYRQMVGMYEAFYLMRYARVNAESVKLLLYINAGNKYLDNKLDAMISAYQLGRINGIREERARKKAR